MPLEAGRLAVAVGGSDVEISRGIPVRDALHAAIDAGKVRVATKVLTLTTSSGTDYWLETGAEPVDLIIDLAATGAAHGGLYRDATRNTGQTSLTLIPMNDNISQETQVVVEYGGTYTLPGDLVGSFVVSGTVRSTAYGMGFCMRFLKRMRLEPSTVYRFACFNLTAFTEGFAGKLYVIELDGDE